ncbi:hypothetical protein, partial [Rhizobium sp. PL01]|uniref:hypothetical protein n=1 Tax=Rhizobium sp. PL01 TaxID=3085631 RepID=UPI0029814774
MALESGCFDGFCGVFGCFGNTVANTATYKKHDFLSHCVLTSFGVWDYKPLTNEGGGAAGDRRTRSEVSYESLVRIVG